MSRWKIRVLRSYAPLPARTGSTPLPSRTGAPPIPVATLLGPPSRSPSIRSLLGRRRSPPGRSQEPLRFPPGRRRSPPELLPAPLPLALHPPPASPWQMR
ncbi:hypothetical protein GUJ93_ZPchr0012g19849 [Zizania palustris]|uniref:Uncharacterized protein n=1 Tax=Zizania palustris TaxID=103762 RepID=A0A8J5WNK2_ZIZPA|nr:hypothetical protein GUJ93_ZPchr0012g19849 [Zizania palustris]